MAKPISEEHALLCGMVWGLAIKHGIAMNPLQDEDGDYSDTLELILPEGEAGPGFPEVKVYLVVQPPMPPQPTVDDVGFDHSAHLDGPVLGCAACNVAAHRLIEEINRG